MKFREHLSALKVKCKSSSSKFQLLLLSPLGCSYCQRRNYRPLNVIFSDVQTTLISPGFPPLECVNVQQGRGGKTSYLRQLVFFVCNIMKWRRISDEHYQLSTFVIPTHDPSPATDERAPHTHVLSNLSAVDKTPRVCRPSSK